MRYSPFTKMIHAALLEQATAFRGNALLLTGPARVGKLELAWAIAATSNCTGARGMYGEACGQCPSCRALAAGAHPDLLLVQPRATTSTGKAARRKIIPIGAVLAGRDKAHDYETHVYEFLEVRPTFSRRVVVVQGAEFLGQEAANALLKLVEEPPHQALFLFVAEDLKAVLPTIVSRSARLNVAPVGDAIIAQAVAQATPQPDQATQAELVAFAAGRAGVVVQAEQVQVALQDALALTESLETGLLQTLEHVQGLEKRWDATWSAEVLRFVWRQRPPAQRAKADDALSHLQEALEAYANPGLSFQVFALRVRQAFDLT